MKDIFVFAKEAIYGRISPTKIMGAFSSALFGFWVVGLFMGFGFAALGISTSSLPALIIIAPIMAAIMFFAYATPLLVLWNIKNARNKIQTVLLLLGCLLWMFVVGFFTILGASGVLTV